MASKGQRQDGPGRMKRSGDGEADQAQRVVLVPATATQGLGDVLSSCHAQQADGKVAQGGHDLSAFSFADAAAVLIEGDITDPVDFVLNRPVATVEGEQLLWTGLLCRQAGDAVDEFAPGIFSAQIGGGALEAEDLGEIGEVEVSVEVSAG